MSSKHPLPLSETLRDLALLRASELNLSKVLPKDAEQPAAPSAAEDATEWSYEFVKQARTTVRMHDRGDVDSQGARVDDLRSKLEEVLKVLESPSSA